MFKWMTKREIAKPTREFLRGQDFESIWLLSFRWCGKEPPPNADDEIPNDVKETAYRIIRGFFKGHLNLRMPNGYKVMREPIHFLLWDLNHWRNVLWRCLAQADFDTAYLSKLYVERSEVLAWCATEHFVPPSFWSSNGSKEAENKRPPLENRLRDEVFDRLACQAIARTYWDIDPNIHPAHMANAKAIKVYGNGRLYKDDNTVKSWIVEVDPRKGQRKAGRPENIPYLIDLETGRLPE